MPYKWLSDCFLGSPQYLSTFSWEPFRLLQVNQEHCHSDDILGFGKDQREHDERLCKVLRTLENAGLKLMKKNVSLKGSKMLYGDGEVCQQVFPLLAHCHMPLRDLLKNDNALTSDIQQKIAFEGATKVIS